MDNFPLVKQIISDNQGFSAEDFFSNTISLKKNFSQPVDTNVPGKTSEVIVSIMHNNTEYAQSLLCSSYIFYLMENYENSLKYFESAENLIPKLSVLFKNYKEKLIYLIKCEQDEVKINSNSSTSNSVVLKQYDLLNLIKDIK
jgi:hypothetical protein